MLIYGLILAAVAALAAFLVATRRSALRALADARTQIEISRKTIEKLSVGGASWCLAVAASDGSWWETDMKPRGTRELPRRPLMSAEVAAACGHDLEALERSEPSWGSLVHPLDLRRIDAAVHRHLKGEAGSFEGLYRLKGVDGGWHWIEVRGSIERDADGRPLRWCGLDWDVTERERSKTRAQRFRTLVEASPNPMALTDAHGLIQYVNQSFTRVTGYNEEDILGRSPLILDSEGTPAATHEEAWSMMASGHEWQGEFENQTKGGSRYKAWVSISPVLDEAGEISHSLLIHQLGPGYRLEDPGVLLDD